MLLFSADCSDERRTTGGLVALWQNQPGKQPDQQARNLLLRCVKVDRRVEQHPTPQAHQAYRCCYGRIRRCGPPRLGSVQRSSARKEKLGERRTTEKHCKVWGDILEQQQRREDHNKRVTRDVVSSLPYGTDAFGRLQRCG